MAAFFSPTVNHPFGCLMTNKQRPVGKLDHLRGSRKAVSENRRFEFDQPTQTVPAFEQMLLKPNCISKGA